MNEFGSIQMIALVGSLILVGSAFASHKLRWKESIRMGLIWTGIFVAVGLLFSMVMG